MKLTFSMEKLQKVIADVLFPDYNACHLCGRLPENNAILCTGCVNKLQALRYKPARMASPENHAPLSVCIAAYPHKNEARELVHLLKYQSDCAAADLLGESMAAALALSPQKPAMDLVIPVPLHATRLEQRGYNQALLLAESVCRHTGLALEANALIRLHATDTQLHRDREQRMQAMRHAFSVSSSKLVRGRHVLLVDDVLTTGATATSCAHALLEAGAEAVSLLTVCRA